MQAFFLSIVSWDRRRDTERHERVQHRPGAQLADQRHYQLCRQGVIYLVVLIFSIIGLVHVCKGQDARTRG